MRKLIQDITEEMLIDFDAFNIKLRCDSKSLEYLEKIGREILRRYRTTSHIERIEVTLLYQDNTGEIVILLMEQHPLTLKEVEYLQIKEHNEHINTTNNI